MWNFGCICKDHGKLFEGRHLNPAIEPTQKGFYRVFAVWILEDDLAFTTGETPGIQHLYTYMKTWFPLPLDTTVCNTLGKIFAEMYKQVSEELQV